MNLIDWAAIVGALAWVPPIFGTIRAWLKKPRLQVFAQPAPEIGFTTKGPIFNLRLAFAVTNRDLVISGVRIHVTHESGEQISLAWQGIVQHMGSISYPQLGSAPFERESGVLALKVAQSSVEERFIKFQNPDFMMKLSEHDAVSIRRLEHLRKTQALDRSFLKAQEMSDLYSFIKHEFPWKPGSYRVLIQIESPEVFDVVGTEYQFVLSPLFVQRLHENLDQIETYYAAEVFPKDDAGEKSPLARWDWVYPEMRAIQ
jgi:hypothetical protein